MISRANFTPFPVIFLHIICYCLPVRFNIVVTCTVPHGRSGHPLYRSFQQIATANRFQRQRASAYTIGENFQLVSQSSAAGGSGHRKEQS